MVKKSNKLRKAIKRDTFTWVSFMAASAIFFQFLPDYNEYDINKNNFLKNCFSSSANFFASISLLTLLLLTFTYAFKKINAMDILFYSIITAIPVILVWEFVELYNDDEHFNWKDIVNTIMAGIVFIVIFKIRYKKYYEK